MLKFNRPPAPDWLISNCEKWTRQYLRRSGQFNWAIHRGKRVNQRLNEIFRKITDITLDGPKLGHCCFCDGYPLATSTETIDHFRPKARTSFPELAYNWENLFYVCNKCQERNDNFDELLIKPDIDDYNFYEYFIYEPSTGDIKPNPASDQLKQRRADRTIELFGLNKHERPRDRMRIFKKYYESSNPHIDDFSYRFLFI